MTEEQKILHLLDLLKTEKFNMGLESAHSLILSYKWLLDKLEEVKEKK